MEKVELSVIGHFHSESEKKYDVPRQAHLNPTPAKVILKPGQNFEMALSDLEGFSHIWLLYLFNNTHWKPKVQSPRDLTKRGTFATRSPYRPSPIGFSLVELVQVKGLELTVKNYDLIDQTKILDIKPYIHSADSTESSKQGWLDQLSPYTISFSNEFTQCFENSDVQEKYDYKSIQSFIKNQLEYAPIGHPNKRVQKDSNLEGAYILSYQYLRVQFFILDQEIKIKKCWVANQ